MENSLAAPKPWLGRLMTADELFARYSTRDGKHELVRGRLVVAEPVGGLHGHTATRLASTLDAHVRHHGSPGRAFSRFLDGAPVLPGLSLSISLLFD